VQAGALLNNRCLWCSFFAWLIAQALKIPIAGLLHEKIDFKRFFASGGMPSSHTAMVVSLALMVGDSCGWDSVYFAMCSVFGAIVMYDAANVRLETGRQGKVINDILHSALFEGRPITDREMKEIVGHTPLEVLGGAIVGIALACFWIFVL